MISDLSDVEDKGLWGVLFDKSKVDANWNNMLYYYQNINSIDKHLSSYLNILNNAEKLSKTRIGELFCEQNKVFKTDIIQQLIKEILLCNELDGDVYKWLIESNRYYYNELNIAKIDEEKIQLLVNSGKFRFTVENYNNLKEHTEDKHISLINKNISEYIEKFDEFEIDSGDLFKILSLSIAKKFKIQIIHKANIDLIENNDIASLVYDILGRTLKQQEFRIISKLIEKIDDVNIKIKIIITLGVDRLDFDCLLGLLNFFPLNFSKITFLNGRQTTIPNNEINKEFVEILKTRGLITSYKQNKNKKIRLFIKRIE